MLEQETETTGWDLFPTEDGIRIGDSILWLDAQNTPDLSFLSGASNLKNRTSSKVIATEETTRLLAINNIRLNALVVAYNQTVAIGQFKLELLPSGSGLGAASLYVENRQHSLLYAPRLQPQKTGISRTMQLKRADTLILGAYTPYPPSHHPSRKKEKERLLQTMQAYLAQGQCPVIVCEPYAIAQEICKLLAEANVRVSVAGSIYRTNKIYESYGSDIGPYTMQHRKTEEPHVIIVPEMQEKRHIYPVPPGPIFMIDESSHQPLQADIRRPAVERFVISQTCDARELKTIIQTVEPREVFITGPYAKQYASELASLKTRVMALFPRHLPTLF
ncbi:MAG: hypothetical protein EOP10_20975 [Proteobacteria bacterium]|nr:MAG: hypothetical protein EOP10_20975 [Pseudomonadota bacterium]